MSSIKFHEKYFVIISVPLIFLGVILALASFVYHSYIEVALRRNNIGGANYYRAISSEMFTQALVLFGISLILLAIAYYISNRR